MPESLKPQIKYDKLSLKRLLSSDGIESIIEVVQRLGVNIYHENGIGVYIAHAWVGAGANASEEDMSLIVHVQTALADNKVRIAFFEQEQSDKVSSMSLREFINLYFNNETVDDPVMRIVDAGTDDKSDVMGEWVIRFEKHYEHVQELQKQLINTNGIAVHVLQSIVGQLDNLQKSKVIGNVWTTAISELLREDRKVWADGLHQLYVQLTANIHLTKDIVDGWNSGSLFQEKLLTAIKDVVVNANVEMLTEDGVDTYIQAAIHPEERISVFREHLVKLPKIASLYFLHMIANKFFEYCNDKSRNMAHKEVKVVIKELQEAIINDDKSGRITGNLKRLMELYRTNVNKKESKPLSKGKKEVINADTILSKVTLPVALKEPTIDPAAKRDINTLLKKNDEKFVSKLLKALNDVYTYKLGQEILSDNFKRLTGKFRGSYRHAFSYNGTEYRIIFNFDGLNKTPKITKCGTREGVYSGRAV